MSYRISVILLSLLFISSCSDDPLGPGNPTGTEKAYTIYDSEMNSLGDFVVRELSNGSFEVTVDLTTNFSQAVSIVLYDDNAVDLGSQVDEFGILDAGTTGVFYERPSGVSLSYSQILGYDGNVGFFDGSERVAYADIGGNALTGNLETYPMFEFDIPGVTGEARFYERENEESLVIVDLENTQAGGNHPAHIHNNTQVIGGNVGIGLSNVNGDTGFSFTNVTRTDAGSSLTYTDLIGFNGYIAVHNSSSDFSTFVTQGDIGRNKFTGRMTEYVAKSTSADNVSGTVTFQERVSGNTLVTINLPNDDTGVTHPVHIHQNTAADGGSIVIDLASFNTIGYTEISEDNSGNDLTYDDMITFNGYVNIHFSSQNFSTNLSQADIGVNAFTGESELYTIEDISASGISGTALFEERISGETLITLNLSGLNGTNRASHIHENSAVNGGSIVINLNQVDGNTGVGVSNISQFNSSYTPNPSGKVTYTELINFDGHIAVHVNPSGGTIISKGNIGVNAN